MDESCAMEQIDRARIEMFCVDPALNKRKRYLVTFCSPTASGDFYTVALRWGRIGGETKEHVKRFENAVDAIKCVKGIVRLRARHGYVVVRVEPIRLLEAWLIAEAIPFEPLPDNQPTLFDDLPPSEEENDEQLSLF